MFEGQNIDAMYEAYTERLFRNYYHDYGYYDDEDYEDYEEE